MNFKQVYEPIKRVANPSCSRWSLTPQPHKPSHGLIILLNGYRLIRIANLISAKIKGGIFNYDILKTSFPQGYCAQF